MLELARVFYDILQSIDKDANIIYIYAYVDKHFKSTLTFLCSNVINKNSIYAKTFTFNFCFSLIF